MSREEVGDLAIKLYLKIREWTRDNQDGKVCLQGEFTLCYIIFRSIDDDIFVFPTTERFEFVRWR